MFSSDGETMKRHHLTLNYQNTSFFRFSFQREQNAAFHSCFFLCLWSHPSRRPRHTDRDMYKYNSQSQLFHKQCLLRSPFSLSEPNWLYTCHIMEPQYSKPRLYGPHPQIKLTIPPSQLSDNDRSSSELRALDCNLTALCDHIQMEGFNSGSFSDIVVHAMGSTYHLHRLILSRSSYFRYSYLKILFQVLLRN